MDERIARMIEQMQEVIVLIGECLDTTRALADIPTGPEPEPEEKEDPAEVEHNARVAAAAEGAEPAVEATGAVDSALPNRGHETEGGGTCRHCGANIGDWSSVDCVGPPA